MKLTNILREIKVLGQEKPIPLSKIPAAVAKIAVTNGQKDNDKTDDVVVSKKASIAVKALRPAQTEIIKEMAFGLAIKFLNEGKWDGVDLESIISNDNYKKPKSTESVIKSANSRRKVTKEQVECIHKLFIAGWTRGQIAVHLGITVDLVQKWKHQKIIT